MVLPIAPPPLSDDVAVLDWAGITVRVAWTLLAAGLRPTRAELLRDARDNAIYHIDPHWTAPHAEDRAGTATEAFVARGRRRRSPHAWPVDDDLMLSERWKAALDKALDPQHRVVLRKHYGEGRSVDALARRLGVDRLQIEGARGGLREVLRRAAAADGVPLVDWPVERVDRLLHRLAAFSPGPCPPAAEVADGWQPGHVAGCARCDRLQRLVQQGVLAHEDLVPPSLGGRPRHTASVLAIQVHPDGRTWTAELARRIGPDVLPLGDDLLLVPGERREAAMGVLVAAAELVRPQRAHLRAALLEGPGSWSRRGLLGPLADQADRVARTRPWGLVDGLGELPAALPAPAAPWRLGIAAAAMTALWAILASSAASAQSESSLQGDVSRFRDRRWLEFDVDDASTAVVVDLLDGAWRVRGQTGPADKAEWAVGDGRYRLRLRDGPGLLVEWTAPAPFEGALTGVAPGDVDTLLARLRGLHADVAVVRWSP